MAVLVKSFGAAECIEVEPASAAAERTWSVWRKIYIGRIGRLDLYESQNLYPGRCYVYFEGKYWNEKKQDNDDWYLKTSLGELTEDGDKVIFLTPNTRYVFRLEG